MVQSTSGFYRVNEELATSPLYVDGATRDIANFFLERSTKGLSWKKRLEQSRSKLDAIQGEEAEIALESHIGIMKTLLNESTYLKRNEAARTQVADYIAERETKYHALKREKEDTQIGSLLETKVIAADTSTKSQTVYSTDLSAKQPLYFIPGEDKATQTAPARPAVKYPHLRAQSSNGVPYSPRPQIPFGSIPAHKQKQRIETASQLARMYTENSLPSTSPLARLIRRNPIKTAVAAGIIGLAGLGAWVAHEYNLYKQPVIAQSTTAQTKISSAAITSTPTTREYMPNNVDMELPAGFNLASIANSKVSSQAKLPEKSAVQTAPVIHTKPISQKSLEQQLSGWFSEVTNKVHTLMEKSKPRIAMITDRLAREYALTSEDPKPEIHFNIQTASSYVLSANTAAPSLSEESFMIRVGSAAEDDHSESMRKPTMPLQGFWEAQTPSGKVIQYAVGNSGLPRIVEKDNRIMPLEAEPLHPYVGDQDSRHYIEWINEVPTRRGVTKVDNVKEEASITHSDSKFIDENFFKKAIANAERIKEDSLNHAKRIAQTRVSSVSGQ